MAADTNINAILSHGNTVKSIYNAKKQNLELQQHFAAQHIEVKKKKDKVKIQKFETDNKIEIKEDNEKKKEDNLNQTKQKRERQAKRNETSEEKILIDIKV